MMNSIRNFVSRVRSDERGLTAVEYAVLGGIIVAALVAVGGVFSTGLSGAFTRLFASVP